MPIRDMISELLKRRPKMPRVRVYARQVLENGSMLYKELFEAFLDKIPVSIEIESPQLDELRENEVDIAVYDMTMPHGCLAAFSNRQIVNLGSNTFQLQKFILK